MFAIAKKLLEMLGSQVFKEIALVYGVKDFKYHQCFTSWYWGPPQQQESKANSLASKANKCVFSCLWILIGWFLS